jgi:hypothetical protein
MATIGYRVIEHQSGYVYSFTSVGPKGSILKIVTLQRMTIVGFFNLAMGDEINGQVDYYNVTNNKDMDKVFATIAEIARIFLTRFPRNKIFFSGNTLAKTRLYQLQVSNNLELITRIFNVYGQKHINGRFSKFNKGEKYVGILVSNK